LIASDFQAGEMEVLGRLIDASNATLLCEINGASDQFKVIYKPIAGERPLWDFPDGNLAHREVAAYRVSELLGLHVVPETILREGPFGLGSVQRWIDVDEDLDIVAIAQSKSFAMEKIVLLDAIINNTDRKFGHILPISESEVYGCDHGLTFHSDDKLRTVLWQFSGDQIPENFLTSLNSFLDLLPKSQMSDLLTDVEIFALENRVTILIEAGTYPFPSDEWPSVPWPPF
jgi:uncharacterized repeat protein (TIGR03843 family)